MDLRVREAVPPAVRIRFVQSVRVENRRDFVSAGVAVLWQMLLYLTMLTLVMNSWTQFCVAASLTLVLSAVLHLTWFKSLGNASTAGTGGDGAAAM